MNATIFSHNIDALARIATLFITFFGYSDDREISAAVALATKSAVIEWYESNGMTIDFYNEKIDPDALEYAGLKLLELKEMADAAASLVGKA